jgi:hypothetical protein
LKRVYLEEPPAACKGCGETVSHVSRSGGDVSEEGHLNLADVPSYSTILVPIKGVDTPTIMMSSVLLFGAKHSPGWFGAAASASVSAWRNMGAEEPEELNGANRFTGYIHVDDTVIVAKAG